MASASSSRPASVMMNCARCPDVVEVAHRTTLACAATQHLPRRPTKRPRIVTASWGLTAHVEPPAWCPRREVA